MIQLGQKVRCIVTGFTGIATARVEYLNGCVQFAVTPQKMSKDSKYPEGTYIDAGQLEIVDEGILPKTKKKTKKEKDPGGGNMSNTPAVRYGG